MDLVFLSKRRILQLKGGPYFFFEGKEKYFRVTLTSQLKEAGVVPLRPACWPGQSPQSVGDETVVGTQGDSGNASFSKGWPLERGSRLG